MKRFGKKLKKRASSVPSRVRSRRRLRRLAFETLEAREMLATITWLNPGGGSWQTAANWDLGRVPGSGDDVVIPDLVGQQTVEFATSSTSVRSVTTTESLAIQGGSLAIEASLAATADVTLNGGAIRGGTIDLSGGAKLVLTGSGGTLDGVTVNGELDATTINARSDIENGLTLNGTATLGNHARLHFNGTQSLLGDAEILFQDYQNGLVGMTNEMTLTLGPNVHVHGGGDSTIGGGNFSPVGGVNVSVVNQGVIDADAAGGTISILLTASGTFTNTGAIHVAGGTLELGGNFTVPGLGLLTRSGGAVNLTGTLDNTGTELMLDASSGSWNLCGGVIHGGTVSTSGGAALALTSFGGILDSVTVNGQLDATAINARVNIENGLTLNGTATLGNRARLHFNGSQSLLGDAEIIFQDYQNGLVGMTNEMTLTLGPNVHVHGGGDSTIGGGNFSPVGGVDMSVVNQGAIDADAAGGAISILPTGSGTFTNTGAIHVVGGTLQLGGNFTLPSLGLLTRSGGDVNLTGTLDNTGTELVLGASSGSWNLRGGAIHGGTVGTSGGAKLVLTGSGGTLDGVIVNGDLDATAINARADILNGLTLNGTATLGNRARLHFNGSQSLLGDAEILFQNFQNGLVGTANNMTLTLGENVHVHGGGDSTIGGGSFSPLGGVNVSVVNRGVIDVDAAGGTISILPTGGGTLANTGMINVLGGNLQLGGNFTLQSLGPLFRSSGEVNLTGTLDNTDSVLTLDAGTGPWSLHGGAIHGGTISTSGGSKLVLTSFGGTLDGVTVNGDLDATALSARAEIDNGLTLNGTATLGNRARLHFNGSQSLLGVAEVYLQNNQNGLVGTANNMTLTLGMNVRVHGGGNSTIGGGNFAPLGGANVSVVNQGVIDADAAGGTISILPTGAGVFTNYGAVSAKNGGVLHFSDSPQLAAMAALEIDSRSRAVFGGDLLTPSSSPDLVLPQGRIDFAGGGTAADPRLLEAMSQDVGPTAGGFDASNFGFGSIVLANNSYVKLVDQSDNTSGAGSEAVYVDTLVLPSGSTLDLNGLTVYARTVQELGAVLNGAVVRAADGGPLTIGAATSGEISAAGQIDEWTFFGRAGRNMRVQVEPQANGGVAPPLGWAKVSLINPAGVVLAVAESAAEGNVATIADVVLPADGDYRIRVEAATGHATNTGVYRVTASDTTTNVQVLNFNEPAAGVLLDPYGVDRWTFAAAAGQQVQFDLINTSTPGITFSLHGPSGYVGFASIAADSSLLTLPASGTYSVEVVSPTGVVGSYSFQLNLNGQTDLTLGIPHEEGLSSSGEAHLFRVVVPHSEILSIEVADPASAGRTELYARFGAPPTRETYDYGTADAGRSPNLFIPSASPGSWYILVFGESIPNPSTFTLLTVGAAVKLDDSYPSRAGNAAPTTLTIHGAGFNAGTTVRLVASGGTSVAPVELNIDGYSQITAAFPSGLPADSYSVRVANGTNSDTLPNALTVTAGGEAHLETNLIVPPVFGSRSVSTVYIEYANTGDLAMPAPLLSLESADPDNSDRPIFTLDESRIVEDFWFSGLPPGASNSVLVLGAGRQPGMLNPGERIRVPVYYLGLLRPFDFSDTQVELKLRAWTESNAAPVDWAALQPVLRPPLLAEEPWNAVFDNLKSGLNTTGDLVAMLNQNARYLGQLSENVGNVNDLWNFELQQAYGHNAAARLDSVVDASLPVPGVPLAFARSFGGGIAARYVEGALGYGWSTPWDVRLIASTDGKLVRILAGGGAVSTFQRDSRTGGYFSAAGVTATLTAFPGGVYEVRAADGAVTRFRSDGKIDYVEDANSNRVSAGYDAAGRLTALSHSSGASLTITYNEAGRINSVSDSAGRTTTYRYDAANAHLTSVTTADGKVTRYTYQTAGSPQTQHALLSIERGGTTRFFDYDSRGRLDDTYAAGSIDFVDFRYNETGLVQISDAAGTVSLYFDESGLPAKLIDPLGNITSLVFDENSKLKTIVEPTGEQQSFTWCDCGRLSSVVNELGQTTSLAYGGPFNRLTSLTDANGVTTRYTYDARGNPLATIYADSSSARLGAYTSNGLPETYTNRRGQTLHVSYNAAGQVTDETFADGSTITFTYDARGNLTTVVDGSDVTTYEYSYAIDGDRLKRVTYPDGRRLDYSYDSFGRRTQMVDQDGFAARYEYDAAGRLVRLRDAGDALLSAYSYDASGRLRRVDKGNGTYTTYAYDAAGRLLSLQNRESTGVVTSSFDYTYDQRSRPATMATTDGTWTYVYDAAGQLTHAAFASLDANKVPNQDLAYFYDAVGNRTKTILNGVTTVYATNNLNQYISVGGSLFRYDADGNLTFDGVRNYTYDQQSRLIRMSGPQGVTEFEYDAFGNRTASITNGARSSYLVDPVGLPKEVAEYLPDRSVVHQYYGLGLSAVETNGDRYFVDFDNLGSVVATTSAAGLTVGAASYTPFGGLLSSTGKGLDGQLFGAQYGASTDAAGLSYLRARFYSNELGRFISQDPLGLGGGDVNLYRYVGNSPSQYVDPTGNFALLPGEAINGLFIGAFVGGVSGAIHTAHDVWATGDWSEWSWDHIWGEVVAGALEGVVAAGWEHELIAEFIAEIAWADFSHTIGAFIEGWFSIHDAIVAGFVSAIAPHPAELGGGISGLWGWAVISAALEIGLDPLVPEFESTSEVAVAFDPNEKVPGAGFGPQAFVSGSGEIPYHIEFENEAAATAPAQMVSISDHLSADFDWSTFRLQGFGFGDQVIAVPTNTQAYQTTIELNQNGERYNVRVKAGIHLATGEVYAMFRTIDPFTQLPPDVLTGFLPPEDGTGRGRGYLNYAVRPRSGLATGTEIRNVADITFGLLDSIATNQVDPHDASKGVSSDKEARLTIDAVGPTSTIAALPPVTEGSDITLSWTGGDDPGGSGVGAYDVYVSDNGGRFTRWKSAISDTSLVFSGQADHTYAFYSVAIDNVGHREAAPETPDAVTTVHAASLPSAIVDGDAATNAVPEGAANGATVGVTAALASPDGLHVVFQLADDADGRFAIDPNTGVVSVADGARIDFETAMQHTITVRAGDAMGRSNSADFVIDVVDQDGLFTNHVNRYDVDGDQDVGFRDIFAIIDDVRAHGVRILPGVEGPTSPPPYLDVDGDDRVNFRDVFAVLAFLRTGGPSEGEGEVEEAYAGTSPPSSFSSSSWVQAAVRWLDNPWRATNKNLSTAVPRVESPVVGETAVHSVDNLPRRLEWLSLEKRVRTLDEDETAQVHYPSTFAAKCADAVFGSLTDWLDASLG